MKAIDPGVGRADLGTPVDVEAKAAHSMRLVLDTNQAARFVHVQSSNAHFCPTVLIPPLVWAEILLAPSCHHQDRINAIKSYHLVFGMDLPCICDRLCNLDEQAIRQFDPVFPVHTSAHEGLRQSFCSPRLEQLDRARELREDNADDAQNLADRLAQYRNDNHIRKSKGKDLDCEGRFTKIEDADERFVSGETAPTRTTFLNKITNSGARSINTTSEDSFYRAILENCQLRRFLRMSVTFSLSYANHWADQELNRMDPARNRNDFTDMTLPLYARQDDVIITDDRFFRRAFRHIDPECLVGLSTWDEVVANS